MITDLSSTMEIDRIFLCWKRLKSSPPAVLECSVNYFRPSYPTMLRSVEVVSLTQGTWAFVLSLPALPHTLLRLWNQYSVHLWKQLFSFHYAPELLSSILNGTQRLVSLVTWLSREVSQLQKATVTKGIYVLWLHNKVGIQKVHYGMSVCLSFCLSVLCLCFNTKYWQNCVFLDFSPLQRELWPGVI